MNKLLAAIIGLVLTAQAQIMFVADIASPKDPDWGFELWPGFSGVVEATRLPSGLWEFTGTWDAGGSGYTVYAAYWYEQRPIGAPILYSSPLTTSPATWETPYWVQPGELWNGSPVWLCDGSGDLAIAPGGHFYQVFPEPAAASLAALCLLGFTLRRRRVLPALCLTMCLAAPVFAADDDPVPIELVTTRVVAQSQTVEFDLKLTFSAVYLQDGSRYQDVKRAAVRKVVTAPTVTLVSTNGGTEYQLGDVVDVVNASQWYDITAKFLTIGDGLTAEGYFRQAATNGTTRPKRWWTQASEGR